MKKTKIFFHFTCFVLIFAILFVTATEVLKDKRVELEYDVTSKVKGFYQEPKNSLDFVFVGSSQLYADIAPNVLFEEFGITSYDFCANEQPLWISYYYIKEALKHQNPKAIILDVFTVYGNTYEDEGVNHINLDDLPWSMNKVLAIRDAVPKDERGAFYFELVKYHDTWNTLDEKKIMNSFYQKRNVYKGYSPFVVPHNYADMPSEEVMLQTQKEALPEKAREWLGNIVELTKAEGVDLILIKTPNGNAERQKLYLSVAEFADENDIPFINMNVVFDGEAHINILQAEKVTKYMGEYLSQNYEIEDKRENPAFAQWHEDGKYFYHKKDKCEQISISDMQTYFQALAGKEWVTMFAMKCTDAMTYTDDERAALALLGIAPNYDMQGEWCYLVLLQNGVPVAEGVQVTDMYEETFILDDGHEYKLSYAKNENGENVAGLFMDGSNYSMEHDGINLFIYDTLLEEIVEFVAFDTNKGANTIRVE